MKFITVVTACSDHGFSDQSVAMIKIAWDGSPISKQIENPSVLELNSSLVVIGFDEMTPQNTRTMTVKKDLKRNHHQPKKVSSPSYFKRSVLYSVESFDCSSERFIQRMLKEKEKRVPRNQKLF
ncbi:hypothetical protein AVEN_83093-1 [Araneus ventricosus]|uniref:Uncharacterized protein n=1 Tax=Araneus ventricosus TaxID=182803 RepID=A0A4Y2APS3_ARAVE|nr:hypothetical protein AVEN_83093-1 [Araneus ventricosus]